MGRASARGGTGMLCFSISFQSARGILEPSFAVLLTIVTNQSIETVISTLSQCLPLQLTTTGLQAPNRSGL
jgi:hypothetical protein